MNPEQYQQAFLFLSALIISLSVHEFAHAFAAYRMGDDTAHRAGRYTLNPIAHLDPMGTVFLLFMAFSGIGIGWARPVPVNPGAFRDPRRGMMVVAFAGPFSNLMQAGLAFAGLAAMQLAAAQITPGGFMVIASSWLLVFLQVNLMLFAFNLFPVYPLDGSKVLSGILPEKAARHLDFFNVKWGAKPLFALLLWEFLIPVKGPLGVLFDGVRVVIQQLWMILAQLSG